MGTVLLAACQKDDLGIREQEVFTSAYNREFTNTFGDVDPNQNWDATTRALTSYESVASDDGWYYVENGTLTWFKNNMPEQKDNKSKVKSFTLTTTEATTFEIVPLYQGGADYNWTAKMFVNGQSVWSWVKGDGKIEAKYSSNGNWTKVQNGNSSDNKYAKTEAATAVRSKSQVIEVPANATIHFTIWNHDNKPESKNTHTSMDGWIGQLNVATPSNVTAVNPDYSAMIITCEAYTIERTGNILTGISYPDFNEVAFMLVGYVPQVVYEDEESITTTTKRYMMEDFGSIDWDFNDVVVDVTVTERAKKHINTQTNEWVYIEGPTITTTAKIAHLGGTYPVQVKVGDTTLPKISDPLNHEQTEAQLAGTFSGTATYGHNGTKNDGWTPSAPAVTVEGFNPATNNVSIKVWKDYNPGTEANSEKVWTTTFPEAGAKPFIIAVRSYDRWTEEGVSVKTASWWNDLWGTTTQP